MFTLVAVVLPFQQRPGYSELHEAVSVLALGRNGWLQTVAFCALAFGTVAVALALHLTIPTRVAAWLLGVAGLLDFVAAAFPTVRAGHAMTAAALVHNLSGLVIFLLTIAAMVLFRRAFAASSHWRRIARPSLVLAGASFTFLAAAFAVPDWFGLLERLMLASQIGWMTMAALRARTAPL